jgi:hypothetical protein
VGEKIGITYMLAGLLIGFWFGLGSIRLFRSTSRRLSAQIQNQAVMAWVFIPFAFTVLILPFSLKMAFLMNFSKHRIIPDWTVGSIALLGLIGTGWYIERGLRRFFRPKSK